MSYDFNRLLNSALSLNERPLVLAWSASAGVSANVIFLTALEQYKQSPSKAKVKVIYEWLIDQSASKGDGYWGPMNLESDGLSTNTRAAALTVKTSSDYYIGRKTWLGKRGAVLDGVLGNNPAPTLFDGLIDQAVLNLGLTSPSYSGWSLDKLDRTDSIVISGLKGVEYMNNAFRSAGFNTAALGVRLPFKFR